MGLDGWLQLILGFGGSLSVLLVCTGKRVGFLIALLLQPAWIAMAIRSRLWGVLAVSICYTLAWAVGVYRGYRSQPEPLPKHLTSPEVPAPRAGWWNLN